MRVGWIDKAKGMGMCLVILGHMSYPCSDVVSKWIFCFHMPLFFFLSGYLHKNDFSVLYVARRLDGLFVPYVIWSSIIYVVNIRYGSAYMGQLADIIYLNGYGITWFFPCLLITDIICALAVKWLLGQIVPLLVFGILCVVCGNLINEMQFMPGILRLCAVPGAIGFWIAGWLFNRCNVFDRFNNLHAYILAVGVGLLYHCNSLVDLRCGCIGDNPLLTFCIAISWIYLVISLCKLAERAGRGHLLVLNYIGGNSLLVMVVHWIVPTITVAIAIRFGLNLKESCGAIKLISRILNIGALFILVYILSKIPIICGKANLICRIVEKKSGQAL